MLSGRLLVRIGLLVILVEYLKSWDHIQLDLLEEFHFSLEQLSLAPELFYELGRR